MTAYNEILLLEGNRLACCDAKLLADEINASHLLGDRMLDLNAGIHLTEIEIAVVVDQKFDRACAAVADALCQRDSRARHLFAKLGRDECRRAFLNELLMAALYRALTLEQMNHIAQTVAQDLHLNVARIVDIFFHIQTAVAEVRYCLSRCTVVGILEILDAERHTNTLAAAAGGRFEHDRITDALRLADRFIKVAQRSVRAKRDRNTGCDGVALGLRLVAHQTDGRSSRADKRKACLRSPLCKIRIFG